MKRRQFITLVGGAAAVWPLPLSAQHARKVPRIGFLGGGARPVRLESSVYAGFTQGMRQLGYVEGKDFVMEWRFAEEKYERFPALASELVAANVDVIVLASSAAIRRTQQATTTIPIVMATSTDPVGNGFVASLARPGGNTTGLANSHDDAAPKQLELLTTAVPNLSRVGLIRNPGNPASASTLRNIETAAQKASLTTVPTEARNSHEIEKAFARLSTERVSGVMVLPDAVFLTQRRLVAELALKHRLPTIFARREYAEAGGLMSYGESFADFLRRTAVYVDKILKGAKPGDLPVEQPTRFYLVINRKTAAALGLEIPVRLLVLADEVIE